jgi:hypothetical protein
MVEKHSKPFLAQLMSLLNDSILVSPRSFRRNLVRNGTYLEMLTSQIQIRTRY